jgi:nucleoside-diphosphate-sugar epimerase
MTKSAIFDKKNILVTGGAGFIGSHLCDELVKENKVICIDNFSTGDEKNIDHLLADTNFEFIRHDITKPIKLDEMPELQKFKIQFQGIQEIYHLACPMSPKNFLENRMATLNTLSIGMKNVLELVKKHKAKFMHFSSSVVYGPRRKENNRIVEKDEGIVDTLSERSSYDEGKRFAETMTANYRAIYKLDTKIIRLFRIYGPRMKLKDGQMIPDFINSALDNKDLIVFGDESFTSSFCYVSDVIDATLKMMETDLSGPYNIGSDIEVNITEAAKKIISILDSRSKIKYNEKMLFMTPLPIPDITKARNELGWMPVVILEKGLENTIEDLRAKKGLKGVEHMIGKKEKD